MHAHGICLSPQLGAGDELGWGLRELPLPWLQRVVLAQPWGQREGGIACPESWE